MDIERPVKQEYHWTKMDTVRVVGGIVVGVALAVPELTGAIPSQSLTGKLMELGAAVTAGQAIFPLQRVLGI